MTTYQMTTVDNGTRVRDQSNTLGNILTQVNANVVVTGTEVFIAPRELRKADGTLYQMVGDKWLKISYNGYTGWMAFTHLGRPVCKNWVEITDTPPTDPPPSVGFPQSYILTNDDPTHPEYGKRAEYQFVRVID